MADETDANQELIERERIQTQRERRERIATAALGGLLTHKKAMKSTFAGVADWAVRYADALIDRLDAK